jgi:ABC-type polysaccharide/polyol phosphate export permease
MTDNLYISKSNPIGDAWRDLTEGLARVTLWSNLGFQEIKQTYRGSLLGTAWIVLSFLIFGAGLIWFFGALTSRDAAWFGAYLLIGLWIFQYVSTTIVGGCTVFLTAEGWLRSQRLPLSVFVYKLIFRNVFNLAMTGAALLVALVVLQRPLTLGALWAIPGLIVILYTSVWVILLLGLITARLRDLQHIVSTVMRFAFFATPVIWVASDLGSRAIIANYNPLTHFIAVVRDPILDGQVASVHWFIVLWITGIGTFATFFLFARFRRSLIFWL